MAAHNLRKYESVIVSPDCAGSSISLRNKISQYLMLEVYGFYLVYSVFSCQIHNTSTKFNQISIPNTNLITMSMGYSCFIVES